MYKKNGEIVDSRTKSDWPDCLFGKTHIAAAPNCKLVSGAKLKAGKTTKEDLFSILSCSCATARLKTMVRENNSFLIAILVVELYASTT